MTNLLIFFICQISSSDRCWLDKTTLECGTLLILVHGRYDWLRNTKKNKLPNRILVICTWYWYDISDMRALPMIWTSGRLAAGFEKTLESGAWVILVGSPLQGSLVKQCVVWTPPPNQTIFHYSIEFFFTKLRWHIKMALMVDRLKTSPLLVIITYHHLFLTSSSIVFTWTST